MKKITVGVVGCGQIAQIAHLPYLQELPQFEIGALCDISSKVVESLGEKYKVKHLFTDYRDMVKREDLDAILIANKNHALPAIAAMEAGKHVLVEKPIAFNLKQADEMIAAAKRNKVKLMVGYMKRYDPAFETAQKIVTQMDGIFMIRVHDFAGTYQINHEIYDLVEASDLSPEIIEETRKQDQADMLQDIGTDRLDLLDAHDIMIHLAIHDINALHGLYGLPQKLVAASLFDSNIVTALFQYANNVHVVWESGSIITLVEWDEQIRVWGKDKRIEIRFPFPYLKNAPTLLLIDENDGSAAIKKQITCSFDEAFKREWRHFYDCIVYDHQPRTSAVEAREDLAFAVNLLQQAALTKEG